MTIEEVAAFAGERRVCRHQGSCVVNLRPAEVEKWRAAGAEVSEWRANGTDYAEARLAPMLDEPTELDDEGYVIDNRATIALDYFRERDGYTWPARAGGPL